MPPCAVDLQLQGMPNNVTKDFKYLKPIYTNKIITVVMKILLSSV